MKATFEFDFLREPHIQEEQERFMRHVKADDMCMVLYEFDVYLREHHAEHEITKTFRDLLELRGINFDEIWT